ncbi:MAG: oxygenase MpaB family protein, partial [Actinomycetota bacterium]
RRKFSNQELDAYVAELVPQALALGAVSVPRTMGEVDSYFSSIRPELSFGEQAKDVRSFLLAGVAKRPLDRIAYGVVVAAAVSVLPSWARSMLRLPLLPLARPLVIRPAAQAFAKTIRLALPSPADI